MIQAQRDSPHQAQALALSWPRGVLLLLPALVAAASATVPPAPLAYSTAELRPLVAWIALYPDPLLAQVLTAATYPADIEAAARWADEHHYLTGRKLAEAIALDSLPYAPNVQALLPFPSVLQIMASRMAKTQALGQAFLTDQGRVLDVVQELRRVAWDYGFLGAHPRMSVVEGADAIEILPVDPRFVPVPTYRPRQVFAAPVPGVPTGAAFNCDRGVSLDRWFQPGGWGSTTLSWSDHTVMQAKAASERRAPRPREQPQMGRAQELESGDQVDGRHGSFAEIRPVDPEFLSLPGEPPQFGPVPPRPGAPPYSAIYFGFSIRLGHRVEP